MTLASDHPRPERAALGPPQFGLRTLFWLMTCFSVLFAVMASMELAWSAALILLLLLITAHVAGNAMGTRLRGAAPTGEDLPVQRSDRGALHRAALHIGSATRLQEKRPVGRGMFVIAAIGAAIGAFAGGTILALHDWARITVPAIVLGAIASAVIGALFGFLAATWFGIVTRAWREMCQEHKTRR